MTDLKFPQQLGYLSNCNEMLNLSTTCRRLVPLW